MDAVSFALGSALGAGLASLVGRSREDRLTPASLADVLQWGFLVDGPERAVILNKDGALFAAWRYHGPDTAAATEEELEAIRRQVNDALVPFGDGWCWHVDAIRRPAEPYPASAFLPIRADAPDVSVPAWIDAERRAAFAGSGGDRRARTSASVAAGGATQYVSEFTVTITYLPPAENLQRVQERIAKAADSAGRRAHEITLVGVSKYVDVEQAAELVAAGCPDLGESRPQELWKKHEAFQRAGASSPPAPSFRWHLIGHLQRNKVRRTLPLISLIHSVDSERLLAEIDQVAGEEATAQTEAAAWPTMSPRPRPPVGVLLEVNTSGEAAKNGLALEDVEPLLASAVRYPNVAIRGLMTMAALEGGPDVAAKNFATLRELRERLQRNLPSGVELHELSMGMSGDFEVAIREGATIVRVGSLLWE